MVMQFLYFTGHKISRQRGFQNPQETAKKFNFDPGGFKICVTTIQQFVWMLCSCWRLICVIWESPPVFVTAQSLCVVTERRDTAVNNSFDNGSAPLKCYNGADSFYSGVFLRVRIISGEDKGQAARVFVAANLQQTHTQTQILIPPIVYGYLGCCFFSCTNCRQSVPVALCGQFWSQRVQDKRNKWHVPLHPANGFKSVSQKWSLWLEPHVGDFKVFPHFNSSRIDVK